MALVPDQKFSTFATGGTPTTGDIIVGLRGGINTKFDWVLPASITTITGTANQVLVNGSSGSPISGAVTLTLPQSIAPTSSPTFAGLTLTSPLTVANGGTGDSSFTAYAVICGGTTSGGALQSVSGLGSSGQVLVSNGAAALPTWQSVPGLVPAAFTRTNDTNVTVTLGGTPATSLLQAVSLTMGWSGQLIETRGGTNQSTYTLGDTLYSSAANTLSKLAGNITAVKQYLSQTGTGAVSAAPVWATISGSDITGAALTKTDDTNVTLTLGGTPTTALLRAASLTLGWTGVLSGTRGGTGVNNGASTITLGGSLTTVGAFASTFTMTGITTVTFPISGTLATTSQLVTPAALTKTDDTNVTLTLGGSPSTALVNAASLTLGWTGQLGLTRGGTAASLTASNGGIVYSTASAMAILAGTATATQMLQSGSNAAPAWSTTTWPATSTINQLLYSSAANVISGLATANNGILVTSAGGVPSIGNTVGAGLTMPSITFNSTSGVIGTTTNNNAAAGSVGELIESSVGSGSGVALTTATATNITSISLTAGDWDVWGNTGFIPAASTLPTSIIGWISTTSATIPSLPNSGASVWVQQNFGVGLGQLFSCGKMRLSLSGTTTVYLSMQVNFTVSTLTGFGYIGARRRR